MQKTGVIPDNEYGSADQAAKARTLKKTTAIAHEQIQDKPVQTARTGNARSRWPVVLCAPDYCERWASRVKATHCFQHCIGQHVADRLAPVKIIIDSPALSIGGIQRLFAGITQ
jgi:hypothetical protein